MCEWVVREWATKDDQTQVICQAELFPTLVARLTWKDRLVGRRVLYFVDNDSARLALIKSYSPILSSLKIIEEVGGWDCANDSTAWVARVPTEANLSDGSSRMVRDEIEEFFAEVVTPAIPDSRVWATDVLR